PRWRSEDGESSREHEADPHHRYDSHRECAAGYDPGAIEKEPHAGNGFDESAPVENDREESADQHRGREAEKKFSSGSGKKRHVCSPRLSYDCPKHYAGRQNRSCRPDVNRAQYGMLRGRNRRGNGRDDADGYHSPARDGG